MVVYMWTFISAEKLLLMTSASLFTCVNGCTANSSSHLKDASMTKHTAQWPSLQFVWDVRVCVLLVDSLKVHLPQGFFRLVSPLNVEVTLLNSYFSIVCVQFGSITFFYIVSCVQLVVLNFIIICGTGTYEHTYLLIAQLLNHESTSLT